MDFLILTAEEVLQVITALDDNLFGQVITTILPEPPRTTRGSLAEHMDPQNIPTREESAEDPINPPPVSQYRGSDYLDPMCVALGLDSRAELRCLQDYLADMDQSVHPVSDSGRLRCITGCCRRKQVVPGGKQVVVVVPSPHFI